jgi:hypothetical protein
MTGRWWRMGFPLNGLEVTKHTEVQLQLRIQIVTQIEIIFVFLNTYD